VLSTIHTMDSIHTIQRIVDSYPSDQRAPMRQAVANILRGVLAQKLITTQDGKERVPCTEMLLMTPYIRQLIADNKIPEVYSAMGRGHNDGMMTFDQDLLRLCKDGKISREAALVETTRPDNFLSMLQGISVKV
jgi:twitching motility protein PilT